MGDVIKLPAAVPSSLQFDVDLLGAYVMRCPDPIGVLLCTLASVIYLKKADENAIAKLLVAICAKNKENLQ